MNGDDSMAFGACFVSANFSSLFKGGKKIEFYHGANYGIKIHLKNYFSQNSTAENEVNFCAADYNSTDVAKDCVRKLDKNATVYKIRNLQDSQKKVAFKFDNDIEIQASQFFEEQNTDDNNNEDNHILNFRVEGVKEAIEYFEKENVFSLPKIDLRFDLDRRGILSLKADAVNTVNLYFKMSKGPNGGSEFVFTPEYVEPYDLKMLEEEIRLLNETGANKTVLDMVKMKKDIGRKRTQELKKELRVTIEYIGVQPMSADQIEEARKKLDDLDSFDELRKKTMDARNSLESEIYRRKEWIELENSKNVNFFYCKYNFLLF